MKCNSQRSQRGASLIVGLVLLVLITLVVTSAFTLSTGNLKSVGNMQSREEAIAAANVGIERVISSDAIFRNPQPSSHTVGAYTVSVAAPVCVGSVDIEAGTSADRTPNVSIDGGPGALAASSNFKMTYWDIRATVNDATTGANAQVHQGIKITLPSTPDPCPAT